MNTSSFIFDLINLILAGNEDMHESLDDFKFRPDTTTNTRVICPCTSELMYNIVNTLAPLVLIGSFSFLQVRVTIKSWTRSKFDQIRPWTAELAALERLEKSPKTYNRTKFCMLIIIDKIYIGIVNSCFSQICNRVMALD